MEKNINIILTGGHAATTAISVINEIKKRHENWKLYWVGPKSAVEGKLVPTLASQIMPKIGVSYVPITTGRLQRKFTVWTIPSILKIPFGIVQAFEIIFNIKPKVIISFGGFASVPISFAAWLTRIPIIIHEQTVVVGRANKLVSIFAKKILIARSQSTELLPKEKTILVGNPISSEFAKIKRKSKPGNPPLIYITGGSSGAQRINEKINEVLYELLQKYKIIHQTGKLDYEKFKNLKNEFPADLKNRYEVYEFIDPKEVPGKFEKADLIISRAGANTLSEIMVAGVPSILIPIPWAAYDEQTKNARIVEKSGLGSVITEEKLTGEVLIKEIEKLLKNWKSITKNYDKSIANLDINASAKFVDEVESQL